MGFFTHNITVSNPIPQEIKIYYSKDFAIISICFLSIFIGIAISWIAAGQIVLGGITLSITFILMGFKSKSLFNNKPRIIINVAGIQTANTPFYKWAEISDERVSGEYIGRGARPMLEFAYPGGKEQIKVESLNIRPQDLDILLKYYRKPWVFRVN
ncbi:MULTISPECIES: hypothetical protein [unclassified Mucilaginibacter]|uniref:hypothetical protein n=1 Tax=unclassified Mucilaginibacter TaxID=2617802 RepID=UPI002AC8E62C|nr:MULTISPECIES: hypothetical protein [unclassified Mucilaginibacter]MEB0262846.1 hypothetical protein [Mucilaginibacter sp. 10I4]MEB0277685.1 hypothetical protein [Mucilaginibacter sp. 10B2]MEB0301944.1 hypothetical protein [Mucilaginibacter sp. 5C4]WPX24688.1 hypothetical protein RHM67_05305 [Mucilaginibacter sp. 5C4]